MSATTKWVIAVAGLLGVNVVAMIALAVAANTGGSDVIPDYYDRGVHYDDTLDQAVRDRALGWHVQATIVGGELELGVRDRDGVDVVGARARVRGYARAHASVRFDRELTEIGPGRFRAHAGEQTGLHDLAVTIERGSSRFTQQLLVEAR